MSNREVQGSEVAAVKERGILSLGYENFVLSDRIVAVLSSNSLPAKRLREQAEKENLLLDATAGRKTRAIVITDSRHVVLSTLSPLKIQQRLHWVSESTEGAVERAKVERRELEWKDGQFAS